MEPFWDPTYESSDRSERLRQASRCSLIVPFWLFKNVKNEKVEKASATDKPFPRTLFNA
jgi:hypothetical protein